MPLALGIGLNLVTGRGRGGLTGAQILLGAEPDGFAVDWTDNTSVLKRAGAIVAQGTANSQLVVIGTLTSGPNGASFDISNNAYLVLSGFSDLATYRLTNTLYGEFSVDALDGGLKSIASFSTTAAGNYCLLQANGATNLPSCSVLSASVSQAALAIAGATPVINTFYKFAMSSQLNSFDCAWAGLAGTPDVAGSMPVNPVRFYLGVLFGTTQPLNGKIKRAMILPVKKSLAAMQTMTT